MPLEIEIKLKVESHEGVRARLRDLNAEFAGTVRETNIFFDRPDRSLRKADSGLRVRLTKAAGEAETKALLTFKGPAAPAGLRSREAYDLHASPPEQVVPLIESLGFEKMFSFEKERESWRQGGCLVELDTLPVFGLFVEIEGPSDEVVLDVQEQLGLGELRPHKESYSRMAGEYLKSHHSTELRFVTSEG